jgi:hypothetical protein
MLSPTKLDFLFYDSFVIYYDFLKDLAEINKKRQRQNHYHGSKTIVHYSKTVFKTALGR